MSFKSRLIPCLLAALLALPAAAPAQENLNDALGGSTAGTRAPAPAVAPGGDTVAQFQAAARTYEQAVGLVVAVVRGQDGQVRSIPFGTAWAFEPSLLGTNSHIAEPAQQVIAGGGDVYVLPNRSRGESYRVIGAAVHPRYAEQRPNAQGRMPVGIPYDVGILQIEGQFPATVRLADSATLRSLDSGTPLGYLGFPMENLQGDNVNIANPVATMQTGIVTSITDYYLTDNAPENNKLIRHNLPATGGASGSPVFLPDGRVVAALNAGNVTMVEMTLSNGQRMRYRTPSAAQVNFAQRIDILNDFR